MSIAKCCPYSEEKEECKYEKYWFHPRFDMCPTCDRKKKAAEKPDLKQENEESKTKVSDNEWHFIKDGDLPKDTDTLYYVLVYTWDFGLSHLYEKYGYYIPTVCEWNGMYFEALNKDAYTNAKNIKSCLAWKEVIIPNMEVK